MNNHIRCQLTLTTQSQATAIITFQGTLPCPLRSTRTHPAQDRRHKRTVARPPVNPPVLQHFLPLSRASLSAGTATSASAQRKQPAMFVNALLCKHTFCMESERGKNGERSTG